MFAIRWIRTWVSIWPAICVAVLGLFLAGLGGYFALRESRVAINIRVDSLRPKARSLAEKIQSELVKATTDALREVNQAYANDRPWSLEAIQHDVRWCTIFVVYDKDRFTTWPKPPMETKPIDLAVAPQSFSLAEEFEFVQEDLEKAIQYYQSCISPATPIPWQRRAQMAIAACRLKQNQPAEALRIYDRLLAEVWSLSGSVYAPTPFSIHMARIDALEALGRRSDAVRAITEVANRVSSGNIGVESMDDAEFMFDRMNKLMPDARETIERLRHDLSVLMDNQNEQKRLDHLARTWLQAQLPLTTPEPGVPVEPTFFFHTAEEGKYGLVYLNLTEDPTEPRIVLAALHLPTLESQLRVLLLQKEDGQDLAIRSIMQPGPDPGPWTISLSPHLSPWLIVPDATFIQQAKAAAARQALSFLALTILLLGALLVTIYLMVAALRRQLALAQLKSQFVANVSHELKTPLALIRLFGETLLAGRVSTAEKANEYFRIITRESERLTHLIDNILDFSRIEAGQKEYHKVRVDVGRIVADTMAAYRYQLEHHGFRHQVTVASDLPSTLIDPEAIQQAIINLINNSIKYSPREKWLGITVDRTVVEGRDSVCVAVSDRGAGFSPEDRKRLFEPFYRVSSDITLNVRGTGLGLSLVKHIVDAHNGRIEVLSRPGQGTTFRIILPAADSGNTDVTDEHS